MAVLDVKGICKTFDKNTVVLRGIDFSLEKGESVAIIGSSGSGKTTLLRCLNFLTTPDEGKILVNGETLLTRTTLPRKKRARFAESGCISGWCSRTSTFSRNIRRCKT